MVMIICTFSMGAGGGGSCWLRGPALAVVRWGCGLGARSLLLPPPRYDSLILGVACVGWDQQAAPRPQRTNMMQHDDTSRSSI